MFIYYNHKPFNPKLLVFPMSFTFLLRLVIFYLFLRIFARHYENILFRRLLPRPDAGVICAMPMAARKKYGISTAPRSPQINDFNPRLAAETNRNTKIQSGI